MRDSVEIDTNEEAISLDRCPVICCNINVQHLHKMVLECSYNKKNNI
jgi:hypothetical protein